jgi:hypothetical protein
MGNFPECADSLSELPESKLVPTLRETPSGVPMGAKRIDSEKGNDRNG